MQTFLLSESFRETASFLDSKRLAKQRIETFQIYNALIGLRLDSISDEIIAPAKGFLNHPAVRMWQGAENLLCMYGFWISLECDARNIRDDRCLKEFFERRANRHPFVVPRWWLDPIAQKRIIYTHRCNLMRKDPAFYGSRFPEITMAEYGTPYLWPQP
jgi:hypothetical protein